MMTPNAKITLSDKELSLVTDPGIILTKCAIMDAVANLLAQQVDVIRHFFASIPTLPDEVRQTTPKISRGENYRQLPWMMLDYPRLFSKEDVFAVRTMFWWGQCCSVTLLLSGKYQEAFVKNISVQSVRNIPGLYICVQDDPWEHHYEEDNYMPADQLTDSAIAVQWQHSGIVKISLRFNLEDWNNMSALFEKAYQQFSGLLISCQGGETIP